MDGMKVFCPPLCGTLAIVFSVLFAFMCESFKFKGSSFTLLATLLNGTDNELKVEVDDIQFSPWYIKKTELVDVYVSDGTLYVTTQSDCLPIDEEFDSKWIFVRAASIITVTYGGILTLLLCFVSCVPGLAAKIWHCSTLGFILICTLFQGLTFLLLKSEACQDDPIKKMATDQVQTMIADFENKTGFDLDGVGLWADECSLDTGSTLNVIGIFCWFFAGVFMIVLGQPQDEILGGDLDRADGKQNAAKEAKEEQKQTTTKPHGAVDEVAVEKNDAEA